MSGKHRGGGGKSLGDREKERPKGGKNSEEIYWAFLCVILRGGLGTGLQEARGHGSISHVVGELEDYGGGKIKNGEPRNRGKERPKGVLFKRDRKKLKSPEKGAWREY